MFNLNYYISFYLFIISCFMFSYYYKHIMLMIISLEFMMISLTYNMFIVMMYLNSMTYMVMFFLTFSVCEGALILSLMVLLVRMWGNDYVNSLSLMKW